MTFQDRLELQFQMVDMGVDWIIGRLTSVQCARCNELLPLSIIRNEKREEMYYDFCAKHIYCAPARGHRDVIL